VDGKRRRKFLYGKTRREAAGKLTRALREKQMGVPASDDRQRLDRFLEHWLEAAAKPAVRPRTYEGYAARVRNHLVPALGRIPLTKLTPDHVQAMLNSKTAEGLSPSTVRGIHAVLRRALNQAMRWGLIVRNVASLVSPPRVVTSEPTTLSPEQVRGLLATVQGTRHEGLYTVALSLGLRLGEALGLKWVDIDLDAGTVAVRRSVHRSEGKLREAELKTERSRRTLALPAQTEAALRRHRTRQLEARLLAGDQWREQDFVFTSAFGTPLEPRNALRFFKRDLEREGLPEMRFHDLRHTCASLLLAQNVHARIVMETLGHARISTTMDLYSHVSPAMQRDAATKMEVALGGRVK